MALVPGRLYVGSAVATPLYHAAARGEIGDKWGVTENPRERPHSSFFLPPEFAATPQDAARSKVEHIFEAVRETYFDQLPSRKRCHFASPSIEAANYWREKPQRSDWGLFRVCPEPSARLVAVHVRFYDYAVQVMDGRWMLSHEKYAYESDGADLEVAKAAAFYWRGDQPPPDGRQVEILVEGSWTLVEGPL